MVCLFVENLYSIDEMNTFDNRMLNAHNVVINLLLLKTISKFIYLLILFQAKWILNFFPSNKNIIFFVVQIS